MEELIARINELSRKHKTVGLTEAETEERARLRKQYLDVFKGNFRNQLDTIKWEGEEEPPKKH
ncbi:uncharacterized protein DUF896 [Paenibacillus cellulosilyticus]|uniref:UPF0291 protein DFQ01_11228 n=1 Tax=Paenibacillus cellulosilyticus TaxID=375489 RepID=A0A2V2YTZ7_9BACL|nr:DUF896 domain-containing protein [Paenibacillus cellulosilyticus]PWW00675.1 uncharacterized protein DUF896 [Paenibacillus cellulosilyticus]QKS45536.1 DUF896 domain-containing protein [Paenibacillus cellulosilyticus]